jgi:hypothetical protein
MGAIKIKSDEVIINNESELITPAIVRQVNDVIDAEVENAKGRVSTLEQNLTTLNSGTIPNGGTTGQVLAKNTNADKDVHWIDSAGGGNASGDYLPLSGGTMTGGVNFPIRKGLSFVAERSENEGGNYGTWISGNALGGFRYIAPIDDFDIHFDFLLGIYHNYTNTPLSYSGDYSANYTARSLVDKAYVDARVLPNGGNNGQVLTKTTTGKEWQDVPITDTSGLLKRDGSNAATANLDIGEYTINNTAGISGYGNYFSLEELNFDTQGNQLTYSEGNNLPTLSSNFAIAHKGYVDSVATTVRIAKKVLLNFPPPNTVITIDHNFNDDNVNVEIWTAFQDGGSNITQQGYKKLELDRAKINIVKTGLNQIKIDVLGGYSTDQTLGTVEIRVYSYPNAIVTVIP